MSDQPKSLNVLFLCTGNSARSIIAEAIMNREGRGRFQAYSAGSHPEGEVNPNTIQLLEGLQYKTDWFRSKSWNEFEGPDAPKLDFVFTVCGDVAAEVCPIWPSQPMTAHWDMPDPAVVQGSPAEIALAFADIYRMLSNRITLLMDLPLASLDRLTLQQRLDDIGQPRDAALKA